MEFSVTAFCSFCFRVSRARTYEYMSQSLPTVSAVVANEMESLP